MIPTKQKYYVIVETINGSQWQTTQDTKQKAIEEVLKQQPSKSNFYILEVEADSEQAAFEEVDALEIDKAKGVKLVAEYINEEE